jgi:hypothetical protein
LSDASPDAAAGVAANILVVFVDLPQACTPTRGKSRS